MLSLLKFSERPETIPTATSWYLSDLGELRGKQELFTKQSPQRLNALKEHAIIESAVSSNRIEGVEVNQARVGTIVFGKSLLHDRNEEEIRGYRHALKLIHEKSSRLQISIKTILELHRLTRGNIWDAGKYKEKNGDIIEKFPTGGQRVRFRTVSAGKTPESMNLLVKAWKDCLRERWIPPLIALAAFNLDFLCIHPFRDGNGRVSRLLLLLQSYHLGLDFGRYISLERLIEENKERYYETLEISSRNWHEGKHNPWPYINFILFILKTAAQEFERRVGQTFSPKGTKTQLIISAVARSQSDFRVSELYHQCPGVSLDMIRRILKNLQSTGQIKCQSRGQNAKWKKTNKWELGNT
jgi:Fic family protein